MTKKSCNYVWRHNLYAENSRNFSSGYLSAFSRSAQTLLWEQVGTEENSVIHNSALDGRYTFCLLSIETMMLAYLALLVALSLPGYLDALHGLYAFDQPELFQKKSNCKPIPANLFLGQREIFSGEGLPGAHYMMKDSSSHLPIAAGVNNCSKTPLRDT